MTTALLVVDVQRGFFDESIGTHDADGVLDRIRTLVERARSAGVPVVFAQHDGPEGHPAEVGTGGWEIHPSLTPRADEEVVRKRASDAFYGTALGEHLADLGVDRVVLAGFATEHCVDATARRALSEGFDVILAADAHTTIDWGPLDAPDVIAHHNAILPEIAHPDRSITAVPAGDVTF